MCLCNIMRVRLNYNKYNENQSYSFDEEINSGIRKKSSEEGKASQHYYIHFNMTNNSDNTLELYAS